MIYAEKLIANTSLGVMVVVIVVLVGLNVNCTKIPQTKIIVLNAKTECQKGVLRMTDKEIIETLEYCVNHNSCRGCPHYHKCDEVSITSLALDLINRQQAEIEKWRYNLEAVLSERADHSEAIKEFADKVKENKGTLFNYIYSARGFNEQIDILVKEMVGEDK